MNDKNSFWNQAAKAGLVLGGVSAVYLAYNTYIVPEIFDQLMEAYRNMPIMTSETLETIEQIMPKMPTIMFFSNLIYCTLFGIIVTAFVSKNTASSNPFKN